VYKCIVKRLLDVVLSIVALPLVGLVVLVVAPLIYREDQGTVFYNAPRIGRRGKAFTMYKFRTMRMNAPDLRMEDGSTYNAPDDPRQTRIGVFLRKTSLDELPQVLNVLKGNMSLIGPRPDLADEVAFYQENDYRKLDVRPGISGYAQVYGRNALLWRDRRALDVYYVDHLSFFLDVRIFFKTFAVVFSQKGVYAENGKVVYDAADMRREDAEGTGETGGTKDAGGTGGIGGIDGIGGTSGTGGNKSAGDFGGSGGTKTAKNTKDEANNLC
jgi:lipopolysaccharide/colanic/teichoic acid biosynthesis glycosyltransferase